MYYFSPHTLGPTLRVVLSPLFSRWAYKKLFKHPKGVVHRFSLKPKRILWCILPKEPAQLLHYRPSYLRQLYARERGEAAVTTLAQMGE